MLHHLPQLVNKVGTKVSVLGPDIKQIIESAVVSGIFLSIVGCSMAEQVHHVWLYGPAHRGEGGIAIQVVLGVVEQIIQKIEYVELPTLRRWFGSSAHRRSFIDGTRQRNQVLGQSAYSV